LIGQLCGKEFKLMANKHIVAGERMPNEKKYYCITCNAESGNTVALIKDGKDGEFVCQLNPKHRFRMAKSGYLEAVPERR